MELLPLALATQCPWRNLLEPVPTIWLWMIELAASPKPSARDRALSFAMEKALGTGEGGINLLAPQSWFIRPPCMTTLSFGHAMKASTPPHSCTRELLDPKQERSRSQRLQRKIRRSVPVYFIDWRPIFHQVTEYEDAIKRTGYDMTAWCKCVLLTFFYPWNRVWTQQMWFMAI